MAWLPNHALRVLILALFAALSTVAAEEQLGQQNEYSTRELQHKTTFRREQVVLGDYCDSDTDCPARTAVNGIPLSNCSEVVCQTMNNVCVLRERVIFNASHPERKPVSFCQRSVMPSSCVEVSCADLLKVNVTDGTGSATSGNADRDGCVTSSTSGMATVCAVQALCESSSCVSLLAPAATCETAMAIPNSCDYYGNYSKCLAPSCSPLKPYLSPMAGSLLFFFRNGTVIRIFHADPNLPHQRVIDLAQVTYQWSSTLQNFSLNAIAESDLGQLSWIYSGVSCDVAIWFRANDFALPKPLPPFGIGGVRHTLTNISGIGAAPFVSGSMLERGQTDALLYGGRSPSGTVFDDISIMSFGTSPLKWRKANATAAPGSLEDALPGARWRHSLSQAYFRPRDTSPSLLAFGGINANGVMLNDVWRLDGNSGGQGESWANLTWTQVVPAGGSISVRSSHAAVVRIKPSAAEIFTTTATTGMTGTTELTQPCDLVVLCGAGVDGKPLSDVWILENIPPPSKSPSGQLTDLNPNGTISAGVWRQVVSLIEPPARALATVASRSTSGGEEIVMFGGRGARGIARSDVWVFSLRSEQWARVILSVHAASSTGSETGPLARFSAGGVLDFLPTATIPFLGFGGLSLWLFGGTAPDRPALSGAMGDFWRLDLSSMTDLHTFNETTPSALPSLVGYWFAMKDGTSVPFPSAQGGGPSNGSPGPRFEPLMVPAIRGPNESGVGFAILGSSFARSESELYKGETESVFWWVRYSSPFSGANRLVEALSLSSWPSARPVELIHTIVELKVLIAADDRSILSGGLHPFQTNTGYILFFNPSTERIDSMNLDIAAPYSDSNLCGLNASGIASDNAVFSGLLAGSTNIVISSPLGGGRVCIQDLSLLLQQQGASVSPDNFATYVAVQPNFTDDSGSPANATMYWRKPGKLGDIFMGRLRAVPLKDGPGVVNATYETKLQLHWSDFAIIRDSENAFTWSRFSSGCRLVETCDDNIACTLDTCSESEGCVPVPNNTACDDGRIFTIDTCDPVDGCIVTAKQITSSSSTGGNIDIIVGTLCGLALLVTVIVGGLFVWYHRRRKFDTEFAELDFLAFGGAPLLTDVTIERMIGKGAYGAVYCGDWRGTTVACKSLDAGAEMIVAEADREASVLRRLNHPGIVNLLGVLYGPSQADTVTSDVPFLVFEFCEYGSVLQFLTSSAAPPPASLLFGLLHNIVVALVYLHGEFVIHNDIACRNLLVSKGPRCKLADFGHAVVTSKTEPFRQLSTEIALAVRWSSPEALSSHNRMVSPASDMWMLCMCALELFSLGSVPLAGLSNASAAQVIVGGEARNHVATKGCPNELADLLLDSCLCQEPADRKSAQELLRSLNALRGSLFGNEGEMGSNDLSWESAAHQNRHYEPLGNDRSNSPPRSWAGQTAVLRTNAFGGGDDYQAGPHEQFTGETSVPLAAEVAWTKAIVPTRSLEMSDASSEDTSV